LPLSEVKEVLPLSEVKEALRLSASGHADGKIILRPQDEEK